MEASFVILSIITGFAAGISGGFWGAGGGWLIVPALMLMGVDLSIAIPASLIQMLPSSSITVFRQFRKIGWTKGEWGMTVALPLCAMSFIGGFFGKSVGSFIENTFQSRTPHQALYVLLLGYIFFVTLFKSSKDPVLSVEHHSETKEKSKTLQTGIAGFFIGVISSLLGIGGGSITRPVMRSLLNVPEKATGMISRLSVFIVALSGSASYLWAISDWKSSDPGVQAIMIAALLAVGGIAGFSIGAKMHNIVLIAENDSAAHKSFGIVCALVCFGVTCKLLNLIILGQVVLATSGGVLIVYLSTLTYLSKRKIHNRLNPNENKSQ